ncbi:hypothetical protein JOD54_006658 [Actinokineospora baliensis]|uniref:DUF6461 domain-containing protein n=1 Tax=Actinokineospora baliensis TaxID=547056 RepID=UPI00195ED4B4|nr:DUF6461 domain-containing protein [Actinokineospora baliensis]MBM7776454.1 hypothetical protein [Actinokineospora baliensis]
MRRYRWADEDADLAWTVAVTSGRSVGQVVRAYGGDTLVGRLSFAEAAVGPGELGAVSLLRVQEVGEHVVVVENNGWRGKAAGVAERASAGNGTFLSVFWNLNANYKVTQAADGQLTASFDPLTVQHPAPPGEVYPPWITDVVFTDGALHAELLAVLEHETGLAFDPAWLDTAWPTYRALA